MTDCLPTRDWLARDPGDRYDPPRLGQRRCRCCLRWIGWGPAAMQNHDRLHLLEYLSERGDALRWASPWVLALWGPE